MLLYVCKSGVTFCTRIFPVMWKYFSFWNGLIPAWKSVTTPLSITSIWVGKFQIAMFKNCYVQKHSQKGAVWVYLTLSSKWNEPRRQKTGLRGFRPGPTQTGLRSLRKCLEAWKFCFEEGEELYYPCSKNKDADQLRGYREADLRLCFRICKNPVFWRRGSYITGFYCNYLIEGKNS